MWGHPFQTRFPKSGPTYGRHVVIPWHQTPKGQPVVKAWNSPAEYPRTESKHDIREVKGDMFNPIFEENVHRQKHPGRCIVTESELPSLREPKCVVKNDMSKTKFYFLDFPGLLEENHLIHALSQDWNRGFFFFLKFKIITRISWPLKKLNIYHEINAEEGKFV